MRLLCCADTHGRRPPALDETGVTAWLHAGDIENGPDVDTSMLEFNPLDDPILSPVATWFRERSIPVHLVRGNHDCIDVYYAFEDGRDVSDRVIALAPNVWLVGLGWHGERYYELPTESDLAQSIAMLDRLMLRLVMPRNHVIMLAHYPARIDELRRPHPSNQLDSQVLRDFIDRVCPILVVEGHVHERASTSLVIERDDGRHTTVVNPGRQGSVIDVDFDARNVDVTPSSPPPHLYSARP